MNAEYIIATAFGFLLAAAYLGYSFFRDRKALFQNDYSCESITKICNRLIDEQKRTAKPKSALGAFSFRNQPMAQDSQGNTAAPKSSSLKVLETFACRE